MKVIAQLVQKKYLVVEDEVEYVPQMTYALLVDITTGEVTGPWPVDSMTARDYWQDPLPNDPNSTKAIIMAMDYKRRK